MRTPKILVLASERFRALVLRISRFSAAFLLATSGAVGPVQAQDLPFDPSSIDQLSPAQKERAKQALSQAQQDNSDTASLKSAAKALNDGPSDTAKPSRLRIDENLGQNAGARNYEESYRAGGPLKPFGYELFADSPNAFKPVTDIPIPSDYVLGPGDVVRVQLYGNQNGSYNLSVNRDGRINFPKLGPIDVAGQHFDDARAMLEERVGREMIGVQTSITLGELRSIQVFLLGDVNHPGSYTVSSLSTITNALVSGGGVGTIGSLRRIDLKRGGHTIESLDLYDLLLRGDSTHDLRLQPGDVIFVPPVGARVSVDGEVKRPAIYELRGESSVGDILKLAGGLLASTSNATAQVERFDKNQKKVLIQLNLGSNVALASTLQDGDLLRIRKLSGPFDNNVTVIGNVKYPGSFQWSSDLTVQKLLASAQPLPSETLKETYLPLGLIERSSPASGIREFSSFNVAVVMTPGSAPVPLQRDDQVIVLNRNDIDYLDSADVRAVASGDISAVANCAGLVQLVDLLSSERSIRILKSFSARDVRVKQASSRNLIQGPTNRAQASDQADRAQIGLNSETRDAISNDQRRAGNANLSPGCPAIFSQSPRALPYLLEQSVAVYGEVRRPGIYPVVAGTSLQQVVESAGGFSSESDPRNIEYVSYADARKNGGSRYQTLDVSALPAGFGVSPGDIFNFKPTYLGQEVGTVLASGEVRFPGNYGILRDEHLSQLIARAGGLTGAAFPYGSVFTRQSARIAEADSFQREAKDLRQAIVTAVSSGALGNSAQSATPVLTEVVKQLEVAVPVGRVVIESDPTILQAHPELDPVLEAGDALFIPKRPISVTVIGQVLNPGTMAFSPGLTVRQYIERAGGYNQGADSSRVFVILPNGTSQRFKSSFWNYEPREIPPGSEIVVPRDAVPFNGLAFSERLFGILSNLALTAASLAVISRN